MLLNPQKILRVFIFIRLFINYVHQKKTLMKHQIIYLTGFMGAGKSTIGPILANTLGWNYYDVDQVIENKFGRKISDIFKQEGESYFRRVERETFVELSNSDKIIISLGGGAVANQENLDFFKKNGKIIYLKVSPEVAYERLKFKNDRPLLSDAASGNLSKNEFIDKIQNILNSRERFYEQADYIVLTDDSSIGKTVDKIAKKILAGELFNS